MGKGQRAAIVIGVRSMDHENLYLAGGIRRARRRIHHEPGEDEAAGIAGIVRNEELPVLGKVRVKGDGQQAILPAFDHHLGREIDQDACRLAGIGTESEDTAGLLRNSHLARAVGHLSQVGGQFQWLVDQNGLQIGSGPNEHRPHQNEYQHQSQKRQGPPTQVAQPAPPFRSRMSATHTHSLRCNQGCD